MLATYINFHHFSNFKVTEEELRSVLMQSRGHFPNKAELWMKDLVTYLDMRLETCVESGQYLNREKTGLCIHWDNSLCFDQTVMLYFKILPERISYQVCLHNYKNISITQGFFMTQC